MRAPLIDVRELSDIDLCFLRFRIIQCTVSCRNSYTILQLYVWQKSVCVCQHFHSDCKCNYQKRVGHVWPLGFSVSAGVEGRLSVICGHWPGYRRLARGLGGLSDICPYNDDWVTAMATVAVIDREAVFDSLSAIFPFVRPSSLEKAPYSHTYWQCWWVFEGLDEFMCIRELIRVKAFWLQEISLIALSGMRLMGNTQL